MSDFNATAVTELIDKIDEKIAAFKQDTAKYDNKAGARRARKTSLELADLFKEYRKISIK